jgi:hypothetical protein
MKLLSSVALGTAMLATALVGSATPAAARTSFGIYVGPGYYGHDYRDYRYRCDDYWYRRRHPYRCGAAYDYGDDYPNSYYYDDDYYGPGFAFRFGSGHHRRFHHWGHHGHHHHHHW